MKYPSATRKFLGALSAIDGCFPKALPLSLLGIQRQITTYRHTVNILIAYILQLGISLSLAVFN